MHRSIANSTAVLTLFLSACAVEAPDVGAAYEALGSDSEVVLSLPEGDAEDCPSSCLLTCEDVAVFVCWCQCSGGGGGGDDDGTILWEILGGEDGSTWDVLHGDGSPLGRVVERDVRGVQAGEILGIDGTPRCWFDGQTLSNAAGPLYVVRDGSVYRPSGRLPAFTFEGDGVHIESGALGLSSSPEQASASSLRKALIAALYEGTCL